MNFSSDYQTITFPFAILINQKSTIKKNTEDLCLDFTTFQEGKMEKHGESKHFLFIIMFIVIFYLYSLKNFVPVNDLF